MKTRLRRVKNRKTRKTRKGGMFGFRNDNKDRNTNVRDCRRYHQDHPELCGKEFPLHSVENAQTSLDIATRKGRKDELPALTQRLNELKELERNSLGLGDLYDYPGERTNFFGKDISYLRYPKMYNNELSMYVDNYLKDVRRQNTKKDSQFPDESIKMRGLVEAVNSLKPVEVEKQDYAALIASGQNADVPILTRNLNGNPIFKGQTIYHV